MTSMVDDCIAKMQRRDRMVCPGSTGGKARPERDDEGGKYHRRHGVHTDGGFLHHRGHEAADVEHSLHGGAQDSVHTQSVGMSWGVP